MLYITLDTIPGRELEPMGIVKGSTVPAKTVGKDIMSGLKTIVGGEIKAYTEMMEEARTIATQRMLEDAQRMGADAIVGVRYSSSAVMAGASEIMAYGTAVKFR